MDILLDPNTAWPQLARSPTGVSNALQDHVRVSTGDRQNATRRLRQSPQPSDGSEADLAPVGSSTAAVRAVAKRHHAR